MTQKLDSKTGNLQRPVQDLDMAILNADPAENKNL
jgi:hypothetical protein